MLKHKKYINLLWAVGVYLYSHALFADTLDIKKTPVAIPFGSFELSPVLEVGETYNDNIYTRNIVKKDSFLTQTNAGVQLSLKKQLDRYALTYALQNGDYHSSQQDNYLDQYAGLNSHTEFTGSHRLDVDAGYLKSHYMRGSFLGRDITTSAINSVTGPDQYHLYNGNAKYTYGYKEAPSNLELKLGILDYTFDNHPTYTMSQDRTQLNVDPRFMYKILPKTTLEATVENNWITHKNNMYSVYDSNKQRYLLGVTWIHSSQFQAATRAGYLHQGFNEARFHGQELNAPTWDINTKWSPFSYSKIDLSINRDAIAMINNASVRESDRFKLAWDHNWDSRVSTQLITAYESANYSSLQRHDDFYSFGLDLNYGVRRWLGFGVILNNRNLDSSIQTLNFNQNTILFYITGNPRLSDDVKTPWTTWY